VVPGTVAEQRSNDLDLICQTDDHGFDLQFLVDLGDLKP
jgi:hypothetical protein